ncbi:DHHA1 domain protein [uncultured archaeon]|nr:DHHA1 domain protein [uncultured archaeon]
MDLVTHTDLDGVASAYFIKKHVKINEIYFAQPNQINDGTVNVPKEFIIADLPYHEKCSMWFDHHASSKINEKFEGKFDANAPSASQVICDYYKDYEDEEILREVNKADTASFSLKELRNPKYWVLLYYVLDSNQPESFLKLIIEEMKKGMKGLKENPIIFQRMNDKLEELKIGDAYLKKKSVIEGRVLYCDLRDSGLSYSPNRIFAVYPEIEYAFLLKKKEDKTAISIRANSLKRTNTIDLGKIMKSFGGGGHISAAAVLVEDSKVDSVVKKILSALN